MWIKLKNYYFIAFVAVKKKPIKVNNMFYTKLIGSTIDVTMTKSKKTKSFVFLKTINIDFRF